MPHLSSFYYSVANCCTKGMCLSAPVNPAAKTHRLVHRVATAAGLYFVYGQSRLWLVFGEELSPSSAKSTDSHSLTSFLSVNQICFKLLWFIFRCPCRFIAYLFLVPRFHNDKWICFWVAILLSQSRLHTSVPSARFWSTSSPTAQFILYLIKFFISLATTEFQEAITVVSNRFYVAITYLYTENRKNEQP